MVIDGLVIAGKSCKVNHPDIFGLVKNAYDSLPEKTISESAEDFYLALSSALHLEAKSNGSVSDDALADFLTRETHYALVQSGFTWDGSSFKDGTSYISPCFYDAIRGMAVSSFVKDTAILFETREKMLIKSNGTPLMRSLNSSLSLNTVYVNTHYPAA